MSKKRKRGKGRGRTPSKRTSRNFASGKNILVVCEGKTEQLYLDKWRHHLDLRALVTIKIESEAGGHRDAIERAKMLRDKQRELARKSPVKQPYDEVWCVFDAENPNEHVGKLDEAIRLAKAERFEVVVSNPSFEIWYLWHFSRSQRQFETGKALKKAVGEHIEGYSETMDVFDVVRPRTQHAMEQASRVLRKAGTPYPNPSTRVHELLCAVFFSNKQLPYMSYTKPNDDGCECVFQLTSSGGTTPKSCCWLCHIIKTEGQYHG